ncbi:MAG TPA: hypothetical protein VEC36_01330 [Patescibacteria group bacterium]|nr:hypothetical protein [Patescibacteria group bacterium]
MRTKYILAFCISLFTLPCFAQTADRVSVNLKTETFYECFTLSLPDNLKRRSIPSLEEITDIIQYSDDEDSVNVKITKREGVLGLHYAQQLSEPMAVSFYKGTIQRSEIAEVNGHPVYFFLMTGYWNDDEFQSVMARGYLESNGATFNFLVRFPISYTKYNDELIANIFNSVKICR